MIEEISNMCEISNINDFKPNLFSSTLFATSHEFMNCCRNSRLVVDEDDLKWAANGNNILLIICY